MLCLPGWITCLVFSFFLVIAVCPARLQGKNKQVSELAAINKVENEHEEM